MNDIIYTEDVISMLEGKISKSALYALVREKKLPATKIGKRYLFSRAVVEKFVSRALGRTNAA